jgi:hypothetical protein
MSVGDLTVERCLPAAAGRGVHLPQPKETALYAPDR